MAETWTINCPFGTCSSLKAPFSSEAAPLTKAESATLISPTFTNSILTFVVLSTNVPVIVFCANKVLILKNKTEKMNNTRLILQLFFLQRKIIQKSVAKIKK